MGSYLRQGPLRERAVLNGDSGEGPFCLGYFEIDESGFVYGMDLAPFFFSYFAL